MNKFHEILVKKLARESHFVTDDNELKKFVIIDAAFNMNKRLIELLIEKDELKQKFFSEIAGHWIFNINLFVQYMENKNFLNDSYTRYRNKIGLNIGGKFLNQRNEVSLVWPFKDCILEGGQSRENQKRPEIFFNEILAQEEIDQLTEAKVLTNWKRFTTEGEQKVTELKRDKVGTLKENLIIKGNNLLALYSLLPQFEGKVKLIYIDPPYNTENDSFQYNDSFSHSTWLTFMKNRLEIAKALLRKDGFIMIQIDNRELTYLKILCDDVFGLNNFRNGIIVKKGQKSLQKQFDCIEKLNAGYDTILFYSKDSNIKIPNLFKTLNGNKSSSWNNHWRGTNRPTMRFELFGIKPKTGQWRWAKERTLKAVDNYHTLIDFTKKHDIYNSITDEVIDNYYHKYIQENSILDYSNFELVRLSKNNKPEHYIPATDKILLSENWMDINVAGRQSEFVHEKNEEILKRILDWLTANSDIILDFFAGSATTASVAHKMKRQWITIEQMDYIENVAVERLKKVVGKTTKKDDELLKSVEFDTGGISKEIQWHGGGEFVYCELKKYNQTFIDQIENAKNTEILLSIWDEMKSHSFLNYNVDIKKQDESIEDFKLLQIREQKEILLEILNKNQLYVNLSSIDDEDYKVSKEDKNLTKSFYEIEEK